MLPFEDWVCTKTQILNFNFHFLSSPLLLLFLPNFFSFAGHLLGFQLDAKKVLGKAFRWGEVQVVRGKDFHKVKVKHCIPLRSP